MKKKIKLQIPVQTASDVITNSSSEIYQIKSDIEVTMFRELWNDILRRWGCTEDEILNDETIGGKIYRENNSLILDYGIVCNLDQDVFDKLRDIFGNENVKDITWDW